MRCSCQRRAHVQKETNPYDTIVQTTNQAATHVKSLTTTTEYQVATPQIQTGNHIPGINILILTPKGAKPSLDPKNLIINHLLCLHYIIL